MPSTHTPTADTTNNKMATYSTIPAAEEPLVAKPQGKSLKALVAGAAVASWRDADGRAVELDELDDLDVEAQRAAKQRFFNTWPHLQEGPGIPSGRR